MGNEHRNQFLLRLLGCLLAQPYTTHLLFEWRQLNTFVPYTTLLTDKSSIYKQITVGEQEPECTESRGLGTRLLQSTDGRRTNLRDEGCLRRGKHIRVVCWGNCGTPLSFLHYRKPLIPAEDGGSQLEMLVVKRAWRNQSIVFYKNHWPTAADREFLGCNLAKCLPRVGVTLVGTEKRGGKGEGEAGQGWCVL